MAADSHRSRSLPQATTRLRYRFAVSRPQFHYPLLIMGITGQHAVVATRNAHDQRGEGAVMTSLRPGQKIYGNGYCYSL